jgi:hypothetical protein
MPLGGHLWHGQGDVDVTSISPGAAAGGAVLPEINQRKIDLRTPAGPILACIFPAGTLGGHILVRARES